MKTCRWLPSLMLLALICGCGERSPRHIQGYIEADYVHPASSIGGELLERPAMRGQTVRAGDVLGVLDAEDESLRVAELTAATENARLEAVRRETLIGQDVIARSEWDRARLFYEQQQQELAQARWRVDQKRITAPCDGLIHDTYFEPGDWVPAGRPLLAILPPNRLKARFYVLAPAAERLKVGTPVHIQAATGAATSEARVTFISDRPEYTPPVIYSEDRRDKLVFLVEAQLDAQDAAQFHPGQPVEIAIVETAATRE